MDGGHSDLRPFNTTVLFYIPPVFASAMIGSVLAIHRPHQPVGWLFIGLAMLVLISGVVEGFAVYGTVVDRDALPGAEMIAVVADRLFIPWLMVLALILLCVPSGDIEGRTARNLALIVIASGTVSFALGLVSPYDGPFEAVPPIDNPLELGSDLVVPLRVAAIVILHVALIIAAGRLIVSFWRASGTRRSQLRIMALASVALPVFVVGAFVAAVMNAEGALALLAGCFLSVLPIAAALAIERDHLFNIDRLISRGLTYSLLTGLLVVCYVGIVAGVAAVSGSSSAAIALATLATAAIAWPARERLQRWLDQRFNRREFDAVTRIKRFVKEPPPSTSIEQALREAMGSPRAGRGVLDRRPRTVGDRGREAGDGRPV